jgi:hypothetical protein
MIKRTHLFDFAILLVICLAAFFLSMYFHGDIFRTRFVVLGLTITYVLWGIVHHLINRDLYFQKILEYLALGLLGTFLYFSLT